VSPDPYPLATSPAVSAVMKGNRKRDTRPEIALRSALHRAGQRFRKDYPLRVDGGRPIRVDIAFPKARVALFVDGCFWHACPEHGTAPRANSGYWIPKLARNVARDREVDLRLERADWLAVHVWEHDLADQAADRVVKIVRPRTGQPPIRTACQDGGMLRSVDVWRILEERAPRNEWIDLSALYEIVSSQIQLDGSDLEPMSGRSQSPRWKRTVRNALQRKKASGDVAWDGKGRYRFG
jgi:DNA mismatch endonuclease, patch repair protein